MFPTNITGENLSDMDGSTILVSFQSHFQSNFHVNVFDFLSVTSSRLSLIMVTELSDKCYYIEHRSYTDLLLRQEFKSK